MTIAMGHSAKAARNVTRKRAGRTGVLFAVVAIAALLVETSGASSAFAAQAGVTSTSITVGAPYVDLASLQALGISINQGSYPDAYNALVANVNATGGINGRKLKVVLTPVNPTGTAGGRPGRPCLFCHWPAPAVVLPDCRSVDHQWSPEPHPVNNGTELHGNSATCSF
jgi:hypothetical protein